MSLATGFLFGPLPRETVHLCIDMQRLFTAEGPWPIPWIEKILPVVTEIAGRYADRTIFMRFMPPAGPTQLPGMWQQFYRQWRDVTRERLDTALLDLLPALQQHIPPAVSCDRPTYSALMSSVLRTELYKRRTTTLVITGGETDVCVLSTTMAAVDQGFRVVLVTDALCSSSDDSHDSLIRMFHARFAQQIETVTAAQLLTAWA